MDSGVGGWGGYLFANPSSSMLTPTVFPDRIKLSEMYQSTRAQGRGGLSVG